MAGSAHRASGILRFGLLIALAASASTSAQTGAALNVRINNTGFAVGQTMTVSAMLTAGTTPVDAYLVLQSPNGAFRSLQLGGQFVAGIQPIATGIVPFNFDGPIAQYTFSTADAPGTYRWFAVLTQRGTLNFVSPLNQLPFTVGPSTGPRTESPVPPAGGTVSLPNVATVTFPSGTFSTTTTVSVATTTSADTATVFSQTATVFRPASRLPYEVRINTGRIPPTSAEVQLSINVPDSFLATVPGNYQIDVFAQVRADGGEEVHDGFDLFNGTLDAATRTVRVTLPTQVFTNQRTSDGSWEAVLTLAPTPGPAGALQRSTDWWLDELEDRVLRESHICGASNIACPLGSGVNCSASISPNGHFQEARTLLGTTRPHQGLDFRIVENTPVYAAADGTVEFSGLLPPSAGYGRAVILRHADGSATLYAHLNSGIAAGTPVTRGQQVGASGGLPGNPGAGRSTGAHLHFEYIPNGQFVRGRQRLDPLPCLGTTLSGAITVRDNGTLADDAFEVYLNNILLGRTTIGGSNTLAVNNLIRGNQLLRVVCIIAPDNVGTLEVTLSQGLTFQGGGILRSTTLPQGGSVAYTIVVP